MAHRKRGPNAVLSVSYPEGTLKNLGEFERLNAARYAPSGHLFFTYEHGAQEVRAVPFSASRVEITGPAVLTLSGALYPSVSRDGTLAYYLGAPKRLFTASEAGVELEMLARGSRPPACAPAADGRFLMVRRVSGEPTNGILLVQNWAEELKKPAAGK